MHGKAQVEQLPPVHEAWLPREHSLYRPRHSERQRSGLLCAAVFFLTPILLLVLGVRPASFENRQLAAFPSVTDGWGLFTGLPMWAADHLPLRDVAVAVEDGISRGVFGEAPTLGRGDSGAGPGAGPGPVPGPRFPDPDDPAARSSAYPTVLEGRDGWLFLGEDVRGACLPTVAREDVVAGIERLRRAVEASGRTFVFVVAPNKSTMVPRFMPDDYVGKECAQSVLPVFWDQTVPALDGIDLRDSLDRAAADTPLYTPVDSHWTPGGALVMVRALAEAVEPGVTATWRIGPGDLLTTGGDLPPLIGREVSAAARHYDLLPDGETVRSRPVNKQFLEPLSLRQGVGEGVVKPRVAMVADSFSLAATPYLAGAFSDITLVHADSIGKGTVGLDDFVADREVFVFEAVERSLVSGRNALFSDGAIDDIERALMANPVR
ncbi:alginate O-acetyltransferase AlgX-related protein [Actinokineospora sp. 24-640]